LHILSSYNQPPHFYFFLVMANVTSKFQPIIGENSSEYINTLK
jgi:hypothetical protein